MTFKFLTKKILFYFGGACRFTGGLLLSGILLNVPVVGAESAKPGMQRTPLLEQSAELPSKNIKAKVLRVVFPAGFKSPLHTHEGPGPRYIVKGTVKVTEGGREGIYGAGESFWESGKEMRIENTGKETAEIIVIELAPAGNTH